MRRERERERERLQLREERLELELLELLELRREERLEERLEERAQLRRELPGEPLALGELRLRSSMQSVTACACPELFWAPSSALARQCPVSVPAGGEEFIYRGDTRAKPGVIKHPNNPQPPPRNNRALPSLPRSPATTLEPTRLREKRKASV